MPPALAGHLIKAGIAVATSFFSGAAIVVGMAVGAKLSKRIGASIPVSLEGMPNVTPLRPKPPEAPAA